MRRFLFGLLWAVPSYLIGAFGGGYLVSVLSSNTHDVSVEAAMTGAFVLGPLAAIVGFIVGAVRARPGNGEQPAVQGAEQ
jgi:hypothetical protein